VVWLRLPDNLASDPVILNVVRSRSEKTRVLGWTTELMLYCASHLTNGYLPAIVFNEVVTSRKWREILTNPPGGGTPIVHRAGDKCECMINPVAWPDTAADYYLHHYLLSNPTREENDVHKAKGAELRDPELRAAVRHRDKSRCRYCEVKVRWSDRRSAQGGVIDHVDPRIAAGAANLVTSCRGCNSRKGNRTPDAAGMTLLPPYGTPIPATGSESDLERFEQSDLDATTHAPVRDGTGRAFDPTATDPGDDPARPPPAGDAGPAGYRPTVGPPTMTRPSAHPNPYVRSGMTGLAPDDNAGLPDPDALDAADRDLSFEDMERDHYG
jgi:hypothetical protein